MKLPPKIRRVFKIGAATAMLFAAAAGVIANVGDPSRWKPNFDKAFKAPPPANVNSRLKDFAARNSKSNLKKLAQDFFALVDLNKLPASVGAALEKKEYESALNSYREFFMERLATFSADENENKGIRPRMPPFPFEKAYLQTADDLMANTTVFGMIDMPLPEGTKTAQDYYNICNLPDNQSKKGNVRIDFGEPGRANWTWQPTEFVPLGFPHLPYDKGFMSAACGRPHFFTALLVKYIETKDAKYWDKWLAFMDDICLNWRRDTMDAGLNPSHNQNNIEFFDDGLWANLSFLMQKSPEMVKAIPAPTLARLLNRMWMEYMSDAIQYGRNASTARRIMFDTYHEIRIATSFPEFRASQYCIQESKRAVEALPMLSIMPDGSDIMDSRNYNKATVQYLRSIYEMLKKADPPAADEYWFKTQYEQLSSTARFIIRELWVTGGYPHWHLFHAERSVFVGKDPSLKHCVPEAFEDSENARIVSNIFEDGKAGLPSFTSDAFPYGGYYAVRTGWGKQDHWMYMSSTRPVSSVTRPNNNNFSIYAYGRHLLADIGMTTPVTVDECNQIDNGSYRAFSESRHVDPFQPAYGRAGAANAYRTPLKRRWHCSDFFDVLEGEYSGPFARSNPKPVIIDNITHVRQFLFARKLGLWIVTDRMKSPAPHTYAWNWPLYCPNEQEAKEFPGFKRDQIITSAKEQSIKTNNPASANLSIYEFANEPLEMNGFGFKAKDKSDCLVVSAMYPRNFENGAVSPDLTDLQPLKGPNGECGFSAKLPDGGHALYQAAIAAGKLKLDDVAMNGESLLLIAAPDGSRRGIALGCTEFSIGGAPQKIPSADFEFTIDGAKLGACEQIYRPLDLPVIGPAEDTFSEEAKITLSHSDPGIEIRYTLDGSEPSGDSPAFSQPISIRETAVVKARAFRKGVRQVPQTLDGTKVSATVRALFTRQPAWPATSSGNTKPGLTYTFYEDHGTWPISICNLDVASAAGKGTCKELFDVSATAMKNGGYAFIYSGNLEIANAGVYSIHAPPEFINPSVHAGYDLRIFLDNKEWYPATQTHNFGVWSMPLAAGKHAFKVVYINQQNVWLSSDFEFRSDYYWAGDKPGLMISGPGLAKQAIPAAMLSH